MRQVQFQTTKVPLYEPDQLCANTTGQAGANEPEWIDFDCEPRLRLFRQVPDLLLWIRGDAMSRAGLADGAIVALARQCDGEGDPILANWDMVAARVGGEVVVRRVRNGINTTTLELRPEITSRRHKLWPESTSRRHKTVRVDTRADDIEIMGVVIGVVLPGPG